MSPLSKVRDGTLFPLACDPASRARCEARLEIFIAIGQIINVFNYRMSKSLKVLRVFS